MTCSELMSNKFDFNKMTFKIYIHQIVLNIWRPKLKKISKSTVSQQGQLSPNQLQGAAQDTTSGSTSSAIVRAHCAIPEPRTIPGPYQSPEPNLPYQSPGPYQGHTRDRAQRAIPEPRCSTNVP